MQSRTCALGSVITLIAAVTVACSSAAPSLGGKTDDGAAGNSPSPGSGTKTGGSTPQLPSTAKPNHVDPPPVVDGSAPPPPDGGDGGPPPGADCSASASSDACFQCCDTNNPPGQQPADDAFNSCICTTPGVCATACASTFCGAAGAAPSTACQTCLDSKAAAQCDTAATAACNASAGCLAAQQCVQSSACDTKP